MEHITQEHAQEQGLTYYYTGLKCKRNHTSKRYTGSTACVECTQEDQARYRRTPKYKETMKQWRILNKDKIKKDMKEYFKTPKGQEALKKGQEYHQRLDVKAKKNCRTARSNTDRFVTTEATPQWYNKEECEVFYLEALQMKALYNKSFQVDHIVPLRSKEVCGLNVQDNLQVLVRELNLKKRNKFDPDMQLGV